MATAVAPQLSEAPSSIVPLFEVLPWASIHPSPLNPRKHFDQAKLQELAKSMAEGVGIIEPLVVRPLAKQKGAFELVAGERRWRAADIAGLKEVPVIIKQLTDVQVLELMVIENNQREDINPLEEAEGFHELTKRGVNIDHIQTRIGRSRKYVYDRLKLLDLVPTAKQLLLDNRITAGHAILLARLTKEQQGSALDVNDRRGGYGSGFPLFTHEASSLSPAEENAEGAAREKDPFVGLKARSVRELDAWIQDHCRFDPKTGVNRELFPQTALAVEEAEKVVQITRNHYTQPDAKEGNAQRIYHTTSWKRADGELDYEGYYGSGKPKASKTCDRSVLGVVVVGPGRGESFRVCVHKECDVHWKAERVAREKAARGGSQAAKFKEQQERDRKRREAEEKKAAAARAEWKKARPALLQACAEKVKAADVDVVVDFVARRLRSNAGQLKAASELLGYGPKSNGLESAVRALVLAELMDVSANEHWGPREFPGFVKPFGVDVAKVLKAAVQTSAQDAGAPAKKASGSKKAAKKR